jgi:signal-transduction protein with cAMP-binding, CBS, and nucleotidyltransferase domain
MKLPDSKFWRIIALSFASLFLITVSLAIYLRFQLSNEELDFLINLLLSRKKISSREHDELQTAYSCLMQHRFVTPVKTAMKEKGRPDNYINPKHLFRIEQTMLKEIFKRIEKFQGKPSFDFTGQV